MTDFVGLKTAVTGVHNLCTARAPAVHRLRTPDGALWQRHLSEATPVPDVFRGAACPWHRSE